MGTLIHGPLEVEMDDRVLAHLETVIVNKFRRGEPFLLTWLEGGSADGGRQSLWLTPRHPIYFKYVDGRVPPLDEDWLKRLLSAANTPRGLVLVDEDGQPADVRTRV
jgi:hypothetical protein